MRSTNPVIEGALVAKELRGAREASGLTQVQVCSPSFSVPMSASFRVPMVWV